MQIYLARNSVQAGPYTLEQLNNMLATGEVDLNDLMWHEGMAQWQRVGDMTNESHHYNPNGSAPTDRRVTVAELYGNKKPDSSPEPQHTSHSPFGANDKPAAFRKNTQPISKQATFELASISSRILAVIIDQVLAMLCLIPMLSGLDFDFEKLAMAAQDPAVLSQLAESIPTHLAMMTGLLILVLFIVQIFLLIKRGQSIGKLITGVRILDVETNKLPSVTNIILMRTILTNLAYNIPTIGQVILIVDFVMMIVNKKRRSLHDKIAKTIVVKANPAQIDHK